MKKLVFVYITYRNESHLGYTFKDHVSSIVVTIGQTKLAVLDEDMVRTILVRVLTIFTNLRCLKFQPSSEWFLRDHEQLSIDRQPPTFFSSNLVELHMNVHFFSDFLYLLDGPFNQLRILHVTVLFFIDSFREITKKVYS